MKTLLITGIHGFVGSNIVTSLENKYRIFGLDIIDVPRKGLTKTYTWKQFEEIPKIDSIIHLAGKAHDTRDRQKYDEYFQANTELTKKIFNYFLKSDAEKFIFFSSVKAAAANVEGILTEDIDPVAVGPYAQSKLAAEEYIQFEYRFSNTQNQKKVYILRPCMIHGPGNKGNLNNLVKLFRNGFPYPLGAFENRRSFTSITNLCFIIEELLSKEILSGVYNIADDDPVSTNDLIKLIATENGSKSAIWKLNKKFLEQCAWLGSAFHLPFNKQTLNKLTESYIVSNSKIKTALGIDHLPVRSDDGLRKTINAMLKKDCIQD
jgi:nucleoside-diphosphate-sugar epimerase